MITNPTTFPLRVDVGEREGDEVTRHREKQFEAFRFFRGFPSPRLWSHES
jgi:hypothetical protein